MQLFFALSGFILALPFAQHYLAGAPKPQLKSYLWRRVTRLEPPYLIAMTVYLFYRVYVWLPRRPDLGWHYLASILYSHNWVYGLESTINIVAWSLEVEIQFYLLA